MAGLTSAEKSINIAPDGLPIGTIKDARDVIAASKRAFRIVAAFSFVVNLLMLTVPIFTMQVYDRVLGSRSEDTLFALVFITVFCLGILAAVDNVRSRVLIHISSWMDNALGKSILTTSIQAAALHRDVNNVQGLRDLNTLRNFAAGATIFNFFDVPWVPLYIAVVYLIHPALGLVATFGAAILFFLAITNDRATRKPLMEANRLAIQQTQSAESGVRNAEVVEAMGMLDSLVDRWARDNATVQAIQEVASQKASNIAAVTKFFRLLIQVALLGFGVFFALEHIITPGAMMAGSIIMGRALAPIEQMIGSWKGFIGARDSYNRLNTLLGRDLGQLRGKTQYPRPQGRLTCEGVSFANRNTPRPILRNVTFTLEPGQAMGLIGASAAGKSTLARLLVGVWPANAGKIRLDGVDVFTWDRSDFGKYVGYLPQDIELFPGTVKENIARMRPADDASIIQAAINANAHDMILRLPQGYDTQIGDAGVGLSGGQRQRLGLARALFGDPRFLVLDEPNSNLDTEGEAALMDSLKNARADGVTIIVIAHRPSILSFVDKMLVLKDGAVEMFGDRNDVMARLTRPVPNPKAKSKTIEGTVEEDNNAANG